MKCPNCSQDNLESASFCGNCGTRLPYRAGSTSSAAESTMGPRNGGWLVNLAPKDLGGILSETFSVYRSNYGSFIVIALIPQIAGIILAIAAPQIFEEFFVGFETDPEIVASDIAGLVGTLLIFGIVSVVLGLVSVGALIHAVGQHYQRGNVDVMVALQQGLGNFVNLFLAALLITLILIIPALLSVILIGIPVLIFLMVRLYFTFQAVVLEENGPVSGISRSWNLVQDCWWRTFGIGIVFIVIFIGASVITSFVLIPITTAIGPFVGSVVSAAINTLVTPFITIGATLLYLDLRVRKER